MKKLIIAAIAVLVITACGQKNKETAATETETTAETTAAVTETDTEETEITAESTEEASESADAEEKNEKKITGTVIDAAMNSIIIKTAGGDELAFSKEDAEVDLKDGLLIGIEVTLIYTGEIKDGNAADVKVIKITDAQ